MKRYVKSYTDESGNTVGKWQVFGELGGDFDRLEDAKKCAKAASTTPEYDYKASVFSNADGMYYLDYEHGKLVRDGWSIPLKKTGEKAKFKLDGKVVEKPIYLKDGVKVIKHNNKIYKVNN